MNPSRKLWLGLALSLMAPVLAAAPVRAATMEFPQALRGLWFGGKSCDEVGGFTIFANDFGLYGPLSPKDEGKFKLTTFGGDVIVEVAPDRVVMRPVATKRPTPPPNYVREIKDGKLFGYPQGAPNKNFAVFRCATAASRDPRGQVLLRLLRRVDAFVQAYSDIVEACRTAAADAQPCAARIVHFLDLNGDGKIAPAELTSFVRHYAPALLLLGGKDAKGGGEGYESVLLDPKDIIGVEGAAAIFGPILTNIVFANFDFDGNGFLATAEIALTLKQETIPGGAGDALRMLSESRDQAQGMLGAVGGLTDMLGAKGPHVLPPVPPSPPADKVE